MPTVFTAVITVFDSGLIVGFFLVVIMLRRDRRICGLKMKGLSLSCLNVINFDDVGA